MTEAYRTTTTPEDPEFRSAALIEMRDGDIGRAAEMCQEEHKNGSRTVHYRRAATALELVYRATKDPKS